MKNWDLLAKYVSDECSSSERMEIERWMQHHPENEAFLERVRKTWGYSERKAEFFAPNTAKAKQNIWNRIEAKGSHGNATIPLHQIAPHALEKDTAPLYQTLRRLAAAIIVGLAFVIVALLVDGSFFNTAPKMVHQKTGIGQKSLFTLSDGTKIWLNENSEIHYPETFKGETRSIEMQGEAFFDVEENPEKPFTIRTGSLITKVLGTSFNIDTKEEQGEVSVNVVSGRVLFYEEENEDKGVVLIRGEKATYQSEEKNIKKNKVPNENFLAWHTGVLNFDNTRLEEVARTLSEFYGKDINLSPTLQDCHYTATFKGQSLEEVLEILQISLEIQVERNGEEINLKGKGC